MRWLWCYGVQKGVTPLGKLLRHKYINLGMACSVKASNKDYFYIVYPDVNTIGRLGQKLASRPAVWSDPGAWLNYIRAVPASKWFLPDDDDDDDVDAMMNGNWCIIDAADA